MPEERPDEGHSRAEPPSGDDYRKLAESAGQLRESGVERKSDVKRRQVQKQTNEWLKYTTFGLQFVLMLLAPLGLGYWADTYFGTLPWGTLIGFALGAAGAMVYIVNTVFRMEDKTKKDKAKQ